MNSGGDDPGLEEQVAEDRRRRGRSDFPGRPLAARRRPAGHSQLGAQRVPGRRLVDRFHEFVEAVHASRLVEEAEVRSGRDLERPGRADLARQVELRTAFNQFHSLGVRCDAARTRLLIADACAALGDHDTAELEASTARATLTSLCATASHPAATTSPEGLSPRELEVLRLLARGKTNRVIAQHVVISEKTVASHISHIFTKLGVTSRSAATAYAYDHDLVST